MKRIMFLLALICLEKTIHAQTPYIYTIKADSVKITNSCDTAELIIENHTQTVPGFLFNKGRGRTEFRRALSKIDDSIYVVGVDTLKLSVAWLQGGNKFGSTGKFGTMDFNHIDFYTNNTKRGRWTNTGNLLLGTEDDNGNKLAVEGTTYSQIFTNVPTSLGTGEDGPVRLRYNRLSGDYISFYFQDNNNRRGFISALSEHRALEIMDSIGITTRSTPFLSIGMEDNQEAKLSVAVPLGSDLRNVFCATSAEAGGYRTGLTVKRTGNTVVGDSYYDNGDRLQVMGSAYVRDTLKMPNLVSQTDASGYRPVVADASGNVYKMAGWNVRKSATFNGSTYTVPADVDVVFVNSGGATVILPSGTMDREITIKNLNAASVIISGLDPSEPSNTIASHGALTVKYTGSSWVGISKY